MVDAAPVTGRGEVFDELTALADLLNAGEGGLVGLQRTVELTPAATGADGAAFVEFGCGGAGRVVAASGELIWGLGRPVDFNDPEVRRLRADDGGVWEYSADTIHTEGGHVLAGLGMRWVRFADAKVGSIPVGVLVVCYRAEGDVCQPWRSALTFLASFIAMQYSLGRGLPVYQDGPAVAPTSDAFALLDPDDVVRAWNPPAELLTAQAAEDQIGKPWPFPLPVADETIEHQMACGRWIEIRAVRVAISGALAVTFRPRPEAGSDDRDLFIALTGHELRTPVTVIRGYADTLVEHWDSLDEQARREGVFVVGQRARELARLVDRLLSAAGDGSPAEAITALPFDLIDALHVAVDELRADLRRVLKVRLPATLPKAHGDRASLATVLTELATNACKYSPNWVEVELTAGADAQTVWFRIADRGVGIRPEHVERAFERFWQLETGDQRTSGGVGLGLYLVRRIVERQHGWVSLRPRQGGGTVAEIRLPRADASHGEA
jgi:two-component system phosphate regulon sensor histidine kinase PhoR